MAEKATTGGYEADLYCVIHKVIGNSNKHGKSLQIAIPKTSRLNANTISGG